MCLPYKCSVNDMLAIDPNAQVEYTINNTNQELECKGNLEGVPHSDYYVIMNQLFKHFTYITKDNLSYIVLHTHWNTL